MTFERNSQIINQRFEINYGSKRKNKKKTNSQQKFQKKANILKDHNENIHEESKKTKIIIRL